MTDTENIRLSGKSIGLLTEIGRAAYDTALRLAVARAVEQRRDVVSEDDIRACVQEALGDVADHIQGSYGKNQNVACAVP